MEEGSLLATKLTNLVAFPMVLRAVLELGVIDIIATVRDGVWLSPSEIARRFPTKPSNPEAPMLLDRMLRFLASYEILKCRNGSIQDNSLTGKIGRVYAAEPVCKFFLNNSEGSGSFAPQLMMNLSEVHVNSWNKRPEFTAWLLEVKEVNLESLPPWEEKKKFKDFMEDHNTGTFTSKKYYDIDGYYRHKLEKEMKKGLKKAGVSERTVFNDEEQRRLEMQELREKQKEEEVLALKRSMEGGMAQAMKEQARLKEEMVYLYKVGDMEGAAAIQRRLDPDLPS